MSFVFAALTACFAASGTISAAQNAVSRAAPQDLSRVLMNLQQNEDQAEVQKDAAALDRLLADDFFTVQPNGNISTKAEYIALITRSGDHPPPTFNYSDVSVRSYDNTAVVNYRVDITDVGGVHHYRVSVVWARQADAWRVVTFSPVFIP